MPALLFYGLCYLKTVMMFQCIQRSRLRNNFLLLESRRLLWSKEEENDKIQVFLF